MTIPIVNGTSTVASVKIVFDTGEDSRTKSVFVAQVIAATHVSRANWLWKKASGATIEEAFWNLRQLVGF
jgi:hypothetical protein